jgi:hypothetical protein
LNPSIPSWQAFERRGSLTAGTHGTTGTLGTLPTLVDADFAGDNDALKFENTVFWDQKSAIP